MQPGVAACFTRHGGLITRAEALDVGVSPTTIRHEVRSGGWVLVRRGVYADAAVWNALDEHVGRPRLRARAALLMMRRSAVLSHDSAAHELGLAILRPEDELVHVTRPGFTGAWTEHGIKHHLARFAPEQVLTIEGRPVLDAARTAVDIARERPHPHGLVACDSAMRLGVTRAQLWDAVEIMVSWQHVTRVRAAIDAADPGAESVLETLARDLVSELDIGDVETQFPLQLGDRVYWADLRVGNHLFEADGRIKLVPVAQGGVAERDPSQVLWDEKKRQRLLAGEHLGVSRILFEDCFGSRRAEAKKRLLAEYAVTLERFGPDLHERLARNAAEIRRRRDRRGA